MSRHCLTLDLIADADDGTNLSSFALIALITVSAAILVGIPMVYMITTYLPGKRRQTQAQDVEDPRKVGIYRMGVGRLVGGGGGTV